jgi:hypothetical protein
MKKSKVFVTTCLLLLAALMVGLPAQTVKAQCTPTLEEISGFDLTCQVVNEENVTRLRFFLDYTAQNNQGAYGFQLKVFLTSGIQGVDDWGYTLSTSWMFMSTSAAVDVDYDSEDHALIFEALRLDCEGTQGNGFIGEVIIDRDAGTQDAVQSIIGSIVMVDNVDAG